MTPTLSLSSCLSSSTKSTGMDGARGNDNLIWTSQMMMMSVHSSWRRMHSSAPGAGRWTVRDTTICRYTTASQHKSPLKGESQNPSQHRILATRVRVFFQSLRRWQWCKVLWWVRLFVCLLAYLRNQTAKLCQIFVHVACDYGSVLRRWRCDTLYTSGFVDELHIISSGVPYPLLSGKHVTAKITTPTLTKFCSNIKLSKYYLS